MSHMTFKFGSTDLVKFIEIYRNHECLWDTKNLNYKNRDARNKALEYFAKEFGVDGFGPKEITRKIKNLRTQYQMERRKIKTSMSTGSGDTDVYKTKLRWYDMMDSFLKYNSNSEQRQRISSNMSYVSQGSTSSENENNETETSNNYTVITEHVSTSPVTKKLKTKHPSYIESALTKFAENRVKEEKDEFDHFGEYVACALRKLSAIKSIHAQDDIQGILTKYKIQNLKEQQREWNNQNENFPSETSEELVYN